MLGTVVSGKRVGRSRAQTRDGVRERRDNGWHVNRMLDGIRTWFGLPYAATALLEADREALGLDRHDYLLHALFQRSLELREKGAGFDAPKAEPPKRR